MKTVLRAVTVVVAACLALAGQPAVAASVPAKVGLVSFTGGSLSGGKAALTLTWPKASGASSYELFLSTSYSGVLDVRTPYRRTTSRVVTLGGLVPGRSYFIQVRGRNGAGVGKRSSRVGRTTIVGHATTTRPAFRVMTFNVCSEKSGCMTPWSWSTRRPRVLERITTLQPDVLALQESRTLASPDVNGRPSTVLPGYVRAYYTSSKSLYVKADRFTIAQSDGTPRAGSISLGNGRYAVWAEIVDAGDGHRAIAASVHLSPGKDDAAAALRTGETKALLAGLDAVDDGLQVVVAGDFNSHKNRTNDTAGSTMKAAGFRDAFDLPEKVLNQHFNSYNGYETTAVTSVKWGDHVDHVWVRPAEARVLYWAQRGLRDGSRYLTPIPSDHHPVTVDLALG